MTRMCRYFTAVFCFTTAGVFLMFKIRTTKDTILMFGGKQQQSSNISKILNKVFQETCGKTKILPTMPVNPTLMITPLKPYPIVLLVTFNIYEYYRSVPYIQLLYRDYFETILFCGSSKPPEDLINTFQMKYFLFEQPDNMLGGAYIYNCTMQAINMNYNARGILYISDDALLKVESLTKFNMDEIWLSNYVYGVDEKRDLHLASYIDRVNGPKECDTANLARPCIKPVKQIWFKHLKREILNVHNDLLGRAMNEGNTEDKFFTNFLQSLDERSGGGMRFFKTIVDVYYLPKHYWKQFNRLAEVFLKHKIYMEIAVPTILHGTERNIKDHPVTLLDGREQPRSKMIPILFRNEDWYAWHPFKLGKITCQDNDTIQAYCSLFHGQWYRSPELIK